MMDTPNNGKDLAEIYATRADHWKPKHIAMDVIERAIAGELDEYRDLFAAGELKIKIQTLRTASDDLTGLTSKVFPIMVDPLGRFPDKATPKNKAEKVEKIAYGWYSGAAARGGLQIEGLMHKLARHQVNFASGCMQVLPDYDRNLVYFDVVDPRMHLPPNNYTPWGQVALDGTMLVEEMTLGECKYRWAADAATRTALDNEFGKSPYGQTTLDDSQTVKVVHYRSREYWCAAAVGNKTIVLVESDESDKDHPGVCGVVDFSQFASGPLLMGQVGIEAALVKIINLELQGMQQMLTGPVFGPPIVGDQINWTGYNVIDDSLGKAAQPNRLSPNSPMNLERAFGTLINVGRVFNRNPESFQGAGDANSAKAVQTLQSGVRSTVEDLLWSPLINGFPRAFDACLEMERNLWPNLKKSATGKSGKVAFEVEYTPGIDLEGYLGRIKIEPGLGLGGYQAKLDIMQHVQAGLLDNETAMELHPDIKNVQEVRRRIEKQSIEALMDIVLQSKGEALSVSAVAEIYRLIESGKSKFEAIKEVSDQGLLEPPPPPEMPMDGPGGMSGGMPPALAALMGGGGGGPPGGGPPALEEARGF